MEKCVIAAVADKLFLTHVHSVLEEADTLPR